MQGQPNKEFKGQARRLRTALAEMQVPVTHAVALNLIARTHGERKWEALEARAERNGTGTRSRERAEALVNELVHCVNDELKRTPWRNEDAEKTEAARQALLDFICGGQEPDIADTAAQDQSFLQWLEAALRMQSYSEEEFDEVMYQLLGDDDASSTNNQGLAGQLEALLKHHQERYTRYGMANAYESLLRDLRETIVPQAMLPELGEQKNPRPYTFVPMRVSMCAGSSHELWVHVDALEWLAQLSDEQFVRLTKAGLHNTDASDQAALWLAEHSLSDDVRGKLQGLLSAGRTVQEQHPDVVGVTCDIEEEWFGFYAGAARLREGAHPQ